MEMCDAGLVYSSAVLAVPEDKWHVASATKSRAEVLHNKPSSPAFSRDPSHGGDMQREEESLPQSRLGRTAAVIVHSGFGARWRLVRMKSGPEFLKEANSCISQIFSRRSIRTRQGDARGEACRCPRLLKELSVCICSLDRCCCCCTRRIREHYLNTRPGRGRMKNRDPKVGVSIQVINSLILSDDTNVWAEITVSQATLSLYFPLI